MIISCELLVIFMIMSLTIRSTTDVPPMYSRPTSVFESCNKALRRG